MVLAQYALLPNDSGFSIPIFIAPFTSAQLTSALAAHQGPDAGIYLPMTHKWRNVVPGFRAPSSYDDTLMLELVEDPEILEFLRDVEKQTLQGVNVWNMTKNQRGVSTIETLSTLDSTDPYPCRIAVNVDDNPLVMETRKYGPRDATHHLPITCTSVVGPWTRSGYDLPVPSAEWEGNWYDSDVNGTWLSVANVRASGRFSHYPLDWFHARPPVAFGQNVAKPKTDSRTFLLGNGNICTVDEYDLETWGSLPVTAESNWNYLWGLPGETIGHSQVPTNPAYSSHWYDLTIAAQGWSGWIPEGLHPFASVNRNNQWWSFNCSVILPLAFVLTSDGKIAKMGFNVISSPKISNQLAAAGLRIVDMMDSNGWFPDGPSCEGLLMARFNPRAQTTNVGLYALTKSQASKFMEDMFNIDVAEWLKNLFEGDGSAALLGLRWFYGIKDQVQYRAGTSKPKLGKTNFTNSDSVKSLSQEIVEMNMGAIPIPRSFNDHRDYSEVVYKAYIPFVGIIDLSPFDVVGKTVALTYYVNVVDGTAVAQLINCEDCQDGLIFAQSCSWGVDIPLRATPQKDAMMLAADSVVRAVGGAVGGAMLGPAGAVVGAVAGAASGVFGGSDTGISYSVGTVGGAANLMSDFRPKILMYTPTDETDAGFVNVVGLPSGKTAQLSTLTGFVAAQEVRDTGSLPARHADQIVAMLKSGVYL